jgi:lysozyme family protein
MKSNFDLWLSEVLKHEGGFVNHPKDPGGATNKGITIGTLKRLKIDVDGDGDSDLADLKKLRHTDVARVYRLFYWDAVRGDLLPSGLDLCVADFAVNSGVSRAVQHLQRALGVTADGDLGPKTMAAIERADIAQVINRVCDSRLKFMKGLKIWHHFKNGWTRRVAEVRALSLAHANKTPKPEHAAPVVLSPQEVSTGRAGFWVWLINLFAGAKK